MTEHKLTTTVVLIHGAWAGRSAWETLPPAITTQSPGNRPQT